MDQALAAGLPDDDVSVVELLVGELIANAIQHGPVGGHVDVETRCRPDRFEVFVFDSSAAGPVLRTPAPEATSGRGLVLVDALATDWGCTPMGPASKAVWFFLATRPPSVA